MEKRNLWRKSGDMQMTTSAVVEINLPKFPSIHRYASWNDFILSLNIT